MAEELDIGKSLEQALKSSKKLQGDTNGELSKSINFLSRINDLQESYLAKVKSLNKETINTKTIQKELEKANQKKELSLIKISNIEKSLGAQQKRDVKDYLNNIARLKTLEEQISKAKLQNNTKLEKSLIKQLGKLDAEIDKKERGLTINEREYAAAIQANKVAEESVTLLNEQLSAEEKIEKSVGFTGKALGALATKLGLGSEFFEEMVEKARDLDQVGKKLTFGDKLISIYKVGKSSIKEGLTDPMIAIPGAIGLAIGAAKMLAKGFDMVGDAARAGGNAIAGLSKDSGTVVRDLTSGVSSLVKNIPLVGGLLSGVIDGFSAVLDLVIGVDNYVVQTGRQLGMTADQSRAWNKELARSESLSGDTYMNARRYMEAQLEMSKSLGINNKFSKEELTTRTKLKELAGLEEETLNEIYNISKLNGKSQDSIVKSVLTQVAGFQKATGVSMNLQKVLKEAASLGGYLGLQFAKYPEKIAKSILTTKALGVELKKIDSIADSFLDFEASISKEFEAQLLTGKNINLQRARELALANDMEGLAVEIAKTIGTTGDFMKMNRIEQQALTEAVSMSRDEVADMLKNQEIFSKLGTHNTKSTMEMVKNYRAAGKEQELLNKLKSEELYQSLINQSVQEDLVRLMDKIKQSIVDFVQNSNIFDMIKKSMDYLSNPANVQATIRKIRDVMADIAQVVGTMVTGIARFLNDLPWWLGGGSAISDAALSFIEDKFGSLGSSIRSFDVSQSSLLKKNEPNIKSEEVLQKSINANGFGATNAPKEIKLDDKAIEIFQGSSTNMNTKNVQEVLDGFKKINDDMAKGKTVPMVIQVQTSMDTYAARRPIVKSYWADPGTSIDNQSPPYSNVIMS